MSGQIFISYRREDSAAWAGRLYDRLGSHFPGKQIFRDVDAIEGGEDFAEAIEKTLGSCDVLIAIIGKRWLALKPKRRWFQLTTPTDYVRLEIAAALKRGIRVIPVLVDDASMPQARALPDELKTLVGRQSLPVSNDRFSGDFERLSNSVTSALGENASVKKKRAEKDEEERARGEKPPKEPQTGHSPSRRIKKVLLAILIACAFVGAILYLASPFPKPGILARTAAAPSPSVSPEPTKEELARRALDNATKDHPWVNSLGMKFVPVAGTQVLFSVWDTRVQDFEAFVEDTRYNATGGMYSTSKSGWRQSGATWKEPGFSQGANHPVVGVSYADSVEFCKWLTKRERIAGNLPKDQEYRLPKDEEWSVAVGLKNEVGSTPQEKSGKLELYPWDIEKKSAKSWPPPAGAGNYAGEEAKIGDWPSELPVIEGYNDGYPRTSPVGRFEANFSGLHDMGGNVWQWCEEWRNAEMEQHTTLRGASWANGRLDLLFASFRLKSSPDARDAAFGFRCVVAVVPSK